MPFKHIYKTEKNVEEITKKNVFINDNEVFFVRVIIVNTPML
jgi:hypothetical protein